MIRIIHTEYLLLLVLVPLILIFFIYRHRTKQRQLRQFADTALIGELTETYHAPLARTKAVLFLLTVMLLVLSLAGFQAGTKYEEVKVEGLDLVIALDVSTSMNAQDIQPSRLEKAKHSAINLLNRLSGDRVALALFAGDAFIQCPLTNDYGAIRLYLESLKTDFSTSVGTDFGALFETIPEVYAHQNSAETETVASRAMVIFSDGEDHNSDTEKQLKQLSGITVFTVGVGTNRPTPIPVYNNDGQLIDYKKYHGSPVTTVLQDGLLKLIAEKTGGVYYPSTLDETEIERISGDLSEMKKTETLQYRYTEYEERYQFLLFPALLLLAAETLIAARKKRTPKIFNA